MDLKDMAKTTFGVCCGAYGYVSMMFGLKNAGAIYQPMMDKIFKKLIEHNMEVHVDNMLVKSQKAHTHSADLNEIFAMLRLYRLKLNPAKCPLGCKVGNSWVIWWHSKVSK